MSSILANAQNVSMGDNPYIQSVARDAITNYNHYYNTERGDTVTVNGRTIRRVIDGDVIIRRLISSEVLSIGIKPKSASTPTESQVFRVKKTVQTTEIIGRQEKFTATTLELIDEKDRDEFVKLVNSVLEAAMCQRSAQLTQMFVVAESSGLTLIIHDELVDGPEIFNRYRKSWIVFYYLNYQAAVTMESLRDDETVRFPVPNHYDYWLFNVKSLTSQFDPASVLLIPPSKAHLQPSFNPPTPLRQETLPRLHTTAEIIACVEKNFGDVLHLVVRYGQRWFVDLSSFAQRGLLTFGAVVDHYKCGILAHLPSIPSPEWFCQSGSPDVKASFSSSVPWRVNLTFCKTSNVQVTFNFVLRIPQKHRYRLGCAYLCQSLLCRHNSDDADKVVFINEIGFRLEGAFHDDPTTRSTPAYLFIPPLPTEYINNTHCIRFPLPENLFYWSHDLKGRTAIIEEDWEKFGIPILSVQEWIGSSWKKEYYAFVKDHLYTGGYELDGKQYARDHGYPKLIHADPHESAIEELERLRFQMLRHRPRNQAPMKRDTEYEDGKPAPLVSHWARPIFTKWYNSVLATLAEADALNHSVVAC
ncbi:hypothetical protein PQX77_015212 [Marasmius sp. AFHP31]|nr:hypothetical protein PQX77_015212 [Marasmius sp. AFHP31]